MTRIDINKLTKEQKLIILNDELDRLTQEYGPSIRLDSRYQGIHMLCNLVERGWKLTHMENVFLTDLLYDLNGVED